ncbi:MAG: ferredoxin [Bacteroidales bacterium]|nr:ferredoxin [Bacteroidales bacterium]
MNHLKYTVSDECIGCNACVEVAEENFEINEKNKAYLKKQPDSSSEETNCNEALDVCPVDAISIVAITPVISSSNIKETLDKYPQLKPVLVELSPKFKKLQNPAMYNTLARFANFKDAAKLTGVSICEILHTMNIALGVNDELIKNMPECITVKDEKFIGEDISWEENAERYIYNSDSIEELTKKASSLKAQENLVIISVELPEALLKTIEGLGYKFNIEKTREYRISIFNPEKIIEKTNWLERKDKFEILDVRKMKTDPFDIIIKRSYEIEEDEGFILIQRFEPMPLINMLSEMGYESVSEKKNPFEVWVYFHKKVSDKKSTTGDDKEKPGVVIQSATPVAYPVIMRLLQSEKIRKAINIKELKVWEETEKHLGWIVSGKADISFSALVTSTKLKKSDIKIPALFVWDNFCILTRGYEANGLEDIKGKEIQTPLFEEAPPAKITKYLIKASGLNPDDFKFVYGKPFGRPEEIFRDFVKGDTDTVILREPEASYAIKMMQNKGEDISIISYNKIWNEINKGFGSFPNAGIVLKGEFVRKYPELTNVLLDELKAAIEWVNKNRHDSANLSFDLMRQPVENVELFLERVNFDYVEGDELVKKVKDYFDILTEHGVVDAEIDEEFLKIFRL